MFTLEQEKESYMCKTYGYHDGVKRSQNIIDVQCKGAGGEDLECSNIPGMKCSAVEGFSQEELASPANKEACEAHIGGFENTPGSKFTTSICELAYMDIDFFSLKKYLESALEGENAKDSTRAYLMMMAPTCCGRKPVTQSAMCEKYSGGFDDGVDRSEKLLTVECQKLNGTEYENFENAPGFTAFSAFAGGREPDRDQLLSTENRDACIAAG